MRTVVLDPPAELQSWLGRRHALGQDLFDEVWEGEYHVAPAPNRAHGYVDDQLARLLGPRADAAGLQGSGPLNVGERDDYRVPDRAYLRDRQMTTFADTAAIVVEIVAPRDETWAKLDFYFARGVEEILIVDPSTREVHWLRRGDDGFVEASASDVLDLTASELHTAIDWPATDGAPSAAPLSGER